MRHQDHSPTLAGINGRRIDPEQWFDQLPLLAALPHAADDRRRFGWLRTRMGLFLLVALGVGVGLLAGLVGWGLIGLAVMVALAVIGMIMRKRAAQQGGGMAYAGAGAGADNVFGFAPDQFNNLIFNFFRHSRIHIHLVHHRDDLQPVFYGPLLCLIE